MSGYITLKVDAETSAVTIETVKSDVAPTLAEMQKIVGGMITPLFTRNSPYRKNHAITGYVNDEGLLIGLPHGIIFRPADATFDELQLIAGNLVICGLNEKTGDSTELDELEIAFMMKHIHNVSANGGIRYTLVEEVI